MATVAACDGASIKMPLFTDSIRFGKPARHFLVDFFDLLEAEGVEMISRRETFDAPEPWIR